MQTLEEQLEAARVGDEVELRCGGRITIDFIDPADGDVGCDKFLWEKNGKKRFAGGAGVFDIVAVHQKLDDGWIRWSGGECPVQQDATVELLFRSGGKLGARPGGFWTWRHYDDDTDIVAYRLVEPKPSLKERLHTLRGLQWASSIHDAMAQKRLFGELLDILIDREAA